VKRDDIAHLADQLQVIGAGFPRGGDILHAAAARLLDLADAGDRMLHVLDLVAAGDFHTTAELADAMHAWERA